MATNNTKQAFWLALGSLCSFGFGLISSMILSRFFNKADYGTYKQVLYVYNTLLTVFTLGLPKAFSYFLPRVPISQTKGLIRKITNLFFLLGGLFSTLLFLFASHAASILKNPDLTEALRLFAIVPFLMMPTMGLEGILATFKKTKFMALYTVATRLIMLLCVALPVVIWDFGYKEAILGFVLGSFISFILALYLKYYPIKGSGDDPCSVSFREIFRFSLPLLYASIWGIIINSSDQFFISRYFGNLVFAEFSNGAMDLPFIGMITGACASVLSPIFSRMSYEKVDPKKDIYPLWLGVFRKTAMLIYPIVVYCLVFADIVMIALYGHQYESSAIYFRIKILTNFFTIIAFAPLIINTGHVKYYSNVHLIYAFLTILLEFVSVKIIDSPVAISWISAFCQISRVFVMLHLLTKLFDVKMHQLFPIKLLLQIVVPSLLILIIERVLLVNLAHLNVFIVLFVSMVVYVIVYFIYTRIVKLDYLSIVKPLLSQQ